MAQNSEQQPPTAQQIQAAHKLAEASVRAILKDVDLRKWSVDQACGLAGAAMEHQSDKPVDAVKTAREIHAFLTEGAKET